METCVRAVSLLSPALLRELPPSRDRPGAAVPQQLSFPDLNWVGESVAETVRVELGAAGEIVMARDSRTEGLRRLGLRPDADFTKATLIKLGQTLDVDYICYGNFDVLLPAGDTQLRNSSVQITAKFLDLRKLHGRPADGRGRKTVRTLPPE